MVKFSGIKENKPLSNFLVFSGLFFSLFRLVRNADDFYIFAIISFSLLLSINFKTIFSEAIRPVLFWFLPFGVWAVLSSFWSLEPFVSLSRGLFYIFISSTTVLIGFIYKSKLSDLFKIFLAINILVVSISILSLICGIPSDAWTANHGLGFTSIFTHQNTLAAVLMFTLIGPTYFLISSVNPELFNRESKRSDRHSEFISESKEDAKKKGNVISNLFRVRNLIVSRSLILTSIIIILNFFFIYLSYSRSVMLALFLGGVLLVYLLGNLKTNLIFTFLILISGTSLYFISGNELQSYFKKGGSDYSSRRSILWEPSYKAALNGGTVGLGYGVSDPNVESNYKKENRLGELKREKGNSTLALVEETGIVGLVLFMIPLFASFKNFCFKKSSVLNSSTSRFLVLLYSFISMFLIHTQFEGWLVGVSSFSLVIYLTLVSSLLNIYCDVNVLNAKETRR